MIDRKIDRIFSTIGNPEFNYKNTRQNYKVTPVSKKVDTDIDREV
jgi:hypothetical protein